MDFRCVPVNQFYYYFRGGDRVFAEGNLHIGTHHVARQQMNMHYMGGMTTNDDLYQFTADDIAF